MPLARLYPLEVNDIHKKLENLSVLSVFLLSNLGLLHAEDLADQKKPEKTAGF
jgi:hypothetical protein